MDCRSVCHHVYKVQPCILHSSSGQSPCLATQVGREGQTVQLQPCHLVSHNFARLLGNAVPTAASHSPVSCHVATGLAVSRQMLQRLCYQGLHPVIAIATALDPCSNADYTDLLDAQNAAVAVESVRMPGPTATSSLDANRTFQQHEQGKCAHQTQPSAQQIHPVTATRGTAPSTQQRLLPS